MVSTIWSTFDGIINSAFGVVKFIIVFSFLVCVAAMIIPAIYKAMSGKDLDFQLPSLIKSCVIKNNKNKKSYVILLPTIKEETLKKKNWELVESSIPLYTAISIVIADKEN